MPYWIRRPSSASTPWLSWAIGIAAVVLLALVISTHHHFSRAHPAITRAHAVPAPTPVIEDVLSALTVSSGTIGTGGSISTSLERKGVSAFQVAGIEKALHPFFSAQHARPSDRFEIARSSAGVLQSFTYWPNPFEYYSVKWANGVWQASGSKLPIQDSIVGVRGEIKTSLWEAMRNQNVPAEMIYRFAELFGWRIDFLTETRQGDTYQLLWKRHSVPGAVRDGDIIAARFNSQERDDVDGYQFAGDYFDADGDSLRGEFLRAPLNYRRISSGFTEHRFHPILRYYRPHHGIDYSAARGTPAVSIADGTVIEKGYNGGLGNELKVRHSGSYASIYGHLMGYPKGIHIGSHVRQGEVVGYVGSTGLSTGPHLHFGFEQNGQLVNFLTLKLKSIRSSVPKTERAHFDEVKKQAALLFAKLPAPGSAVQTLSQ